MNDIESCGGCVGEDMPGVDCSADVHAAEVSCADGRCVISRDRHFCLLNFLLIGYAFRSMR